MAINLEEFKLTPEQQKEKLRPINLDEFRLTKGVSPIQTPQIGQDKFFQDLKVGETPVVGGLVGKGLDFFTKSEQRFGESIAGSVPTLRGQGLIDEARQKDYSSQQQLIDAIKKNRTEGKDTSRLVQLLKSIGGQIPSDFELNPALNKTATQVIGEAVGVGADILSVGTLGKAKVALPVRGIIPGAIKGAKAAVLPSAVFGGVQSGARSAQENASLGEIGASTAIGGVIGAGAGVVLGGLTGGISGKLADNAYKADLRAYILQREAAIAQGKTLPPFPEGISAEDVAQYQISSTGKLQKSPAGKEMLNANVNPQYASLINESDSTNTKLMREQFRVAERASKDVRYTGKPTDVGGQQIVNLAKSVDEKRRIIGKELNERVNAMPSKVVSLNSPIQIVGGKQINPYGDFVSDLSSAGISIKPKGVLDFRGSRYANAPAIQTRIQNAFNDIKPDKLGNVLKTPQRIRGIRQTLFTDLKLGKQTNELEDTASGILHKLYSNLDEPLRLLDSQYRKLAKNYAVSTGAIKEFNRLLGKGYEYADELAPVRAGELSIRQLSNSSSNVTQTLKGLEDAAKNLGIKTPVSVRDQALFADFLEDLFGITSRTSLQGRVARGSVQAGEALGTAKDIVSGNAVGLTGRIVGKIKELGTPSREQQIEAVRKALFGGSPLISKGYKATNAPFVEMFKRNVIPQIARYSPKAESIIMGLDFTGLRSPKEASDLITRSLPKEILNTPGVKSALSNWQKTVEKTMQGIIKP